jgi:alcohol dehydrogenase (cytochrome c)/quinohemoprotein ethanol dehydrogenase
MQAPKNGYFYILDRKTGQFISGTPYVTVNWSKGLDPVTGRPDIVPAARYSENGAAWLGMPSPAGGHSWQPMSYDAGRGSSLPTAEMPYGYIAEKTGNFTFDKRGWNTGRDRPKRDARRSRRPGKDPGDDEGIVLAWDPIAGKPRWRVPMALPWNGGVLSTAGGVVFQGTARANLPPMPPTAAGNCGRPGHGHRRPPITYRLRGVQYVSVAVGWGGILPLNMEALGSAKAPASTGSSRSGWMARRPMPCRRSRRSNCRNCPRQQETRRWSQRTHAVSRPVLDVSRGYRRQQERGPCAIRKRSSIATRLPPLFFKAPANRWGCPISSRT